MEEQIQFEIEKAKNEIQVNESQKTLKTTCFKFFLGAMLVLFLGVLGTHLAMQHGEIVFQLENRLNSTNLQLEEFQTTLLQYQNETLNLREIVFQCNKEHKIRHFSVMLLCNNKSDLN